MSSKPKININSNSAIAIAEYIHHKYAVNNPIKLQKLLFFLTLESLKHRDQTLFPEKFEAWVFGPVVPTVYRYFRHSQVSSQSSVSLNFVCNAIEEQVQEFIKLHIEKYLQFDALELRDWAHEMTPWITSRSGYDEKERSRKKIKTQDLRCFAQSEQFQWENLRQKKEHHE